MKAKYEKPTMEVINMEMETATLLTVSSNGNYTDRLEKGFRDNDIDDLDDWIDGGNM